jgi:hypothetical protein
MVTSVNAPEKSMRPWPLGHQIGAVQVHEARHVDAHGITYLGQWQDTGEPVLLREYFPLQLAVRQGQQVIHAAHQAAAFAAGLSGFIKAARETQALAHPAYPDILGLWCLNGSAYVAMPFSELPTLEATLLAQVEPPPLKTLLRWLRAWSTALAPLHEQMLAHGGLNPEDLRLSPPHGMVLPSLLIPPRTQGSALPYLAPELTVAPTAMAAPTPASDVYALCAMLYRAMAGQAPLPALARLQGLPWVAAADAGRAAYPARWLAAVDAGLALSPVHRPATVQALLAASGLRPQRLAQRNTSAALHHLRPSALVAAARAAAPTSTQAPSTETDFTHALGQSLRQVVDQARADNQAIPVAGRGAVLASNPPSLGLALPSRTVAPEPSALPVPATPLREAKKSSPATGLSQALGSARWRVNRGWLGTGAVLGLLAMTGLALVSWPEPNDGRQAAPAAPKPTVATAPKLDVERLPATAAGPGRAASVVGPVIEPKATTVVTLGTVKASEAPAQAAASAPQAMPFEVTPPQAEAPAAAAAAPARPNVPKPEPAPPRALREAAPSPVAAAPKQSPACADQLLRASLGDLAPPNTAGARQACK